LSSVTRARRQVRLSRSLGLALTPKAVKHYDKRPYPPGEHGRKVSRKESDFAVRLREKQRLRAQYGLREKQMAKVFEEARKVPGRTGDAFVELLEMRIDSLVLRAGFARTILQARQSVSHRHILIDGQIVDRPSQRVNPGQTIQVKPKAASMDPYMAAAAGAHRDVLPELPDYLDVQLEKLTAKLVRRPQRSEVPVTCDVQLVVEYYAR